MAGKLTPKQEAFARAYVETGNASEAYRRAGYSLRMASKTINETASRLLSDSKISARVASLQAKAEKRHDMTVNDIAEMLREDRAFAREMETAAACVSASMGLAKLYGHLRDKVEHTGKDGGPIEVDHITNDADAFIRSVTALSERVTAKPH